MDASRVHLEPSCAPRWPCQSPCQWPTDRHTKLDRNKLIEIKCGQTLNSFLYSSTKIIFLFCFLKPNLRVSKYFAMTITVTLKVMMIIRGARQWWLTHAGHACAKTSGGTAPCRCCCCACGVVVEVVRGVEEVLEVAEVVSCK